MKTARKGTGTFEVLVHGRAAHAGLEPEKGINSLVAAAQSLQKGEAGATAKYKDAVNCKACHSVHKPE